MDKQKLNDMIVNSFNSSAGNFDRYSNGTAFKKTVAALFEDFENQTSRINAPADEKYFLENKIKQWRERGNELGVIADYAIRIAGHFSQKSKGYPIDTLTGFLSKEINLD